MRAVARRTALCCRCLCVFVRTRLCRCNVLQSRVPGKPVVVPVEICRPLSDCVQQCRKKHPSPRPIIIVNFFLEISEVIGTGKVPDHSRMLASGTAYSRGSSLKCCVAVRIFGTSPNKIKLRRENQVTSFSEKSGRSVRKLRQILGSLKKAYNKGPKKSPSFFCKGPNWSLWTKKPRQELYFVGGALSRKDTDSKLM